MKLRAWVNIFISIIMLVFSGYLLADSSVLSLALFSNPNLNVAIELIRLFWSVVGLIYFLYYLYENVQTVFFRPATVTGTTKAVKPKASPRKPHQKHQKSSQKTSNKF